MTDTPAFTKRPDDLMKKLEGAARKAPFGRDPAKYIAGLSVADAIEAAAALRASAERERVMREALEYIAAGREVSRGLHTEIEDQPDAMECAAAVLAAAKGESDA